MDANEKQDVITMVDVLNEENEYNEQTEAVLAGSDESACTYSHGYVKRQALYSCLTCIPDASSNYEKASGICLACSLQCHDKHELVELYTKRNFRCDCGIKTPSNCILDPVKIKNKFNRENQYNQNFAGIYCTCHRPYPDPDEKEVDEMIQCIVCEDWYHSKHLNSPVPDSDSYSEMICGDCMLKNSILESYTGLAIKSITNNETDSQLDVTNSDEKKLDNEPSPKKLKLTDTETCKKPVMTENVEKGKATYWPDGWRSNLCKCNECMESYKANKLTFIIDLEDTTHYYEEKGKSKARPSDFDRSMAALSTLPHANRIDAITNYNKMKEKLFEYLQTFVVNNQIVTEDDVHRFFRTMKESDSAVAGTPH